MKYEWRKHEKGLYIPKQIPTVVDVPEFKFFTIEGKGNPNSKKFADYIEVLYAVSYAVRMSYKTNNAPDGYYEYTVYPLEGVWDISEEAKKNYDGTLNKDELVFKLMIRQPEFVTDEFADMMIRQTMKKKPNVLLDFVKFENICEGKCVQMLHIGSYDNEAESFKIMQEYCKKNGLKRKNKQHREIYLTDPRKVETDKLKTVLRFQVSE